MRDLYTGSLVYLGDMYIKTVEDLRREALCYITTPERADAWVQKVFKALFGMRDAGTDAERLTAYRKLNKLLGGHSPTGIDRLLCMTARAHPSRDTKHMITADEKRRTADRATQANKIDTMNQAQADILHEGTGLARALCLKIIRARCYQRKMHPSWPVTEHPGHRGFGKVQRVTGPTGSMPLEGDGSPYWIWESRQRSRGV